MVSFRLLSAQDKALICILGIRFFKAVNQIISVISRGWGGVVRLRSLLPQHGGTCTGAPKVKKEHESGGRSRPNCMPAL